MRSIEAVRMHMVDKGHCRIVFEGETMSEYLPFYDYSSSYPDAETADPDEELPEQPKQPQISDDESYMMKLPSGKSIVHRSLALYCKQNVPMEREDTEREVAPIRDYYHLACKEMVKNTSFGNDEQRFKAFRRMARDVRYLQRTQAKYSMQLQVKQNKLQKHFRQQKPF